MTMELLTRIVRIGNSIGTSVSFSIRDCPQWRWPDSIPAIVVCTHVAVKALYYTPVYKLAECELMGAQLDGLCIAIDAVTGPHPRPTHPPHLDYYHWFSRLVWRLGEAPLPDTVGACRLIVPTVRVLSRLHFVKPDRQIASKLAEYVLSTMDHAVSEIIQLAICEQQRLANLAVQAGVLDWMERAGTAEFVETYGSVSGHVGQLRSWLDSCNSDHDNHDDHGSGGSGDASAKRPRLNQ
jgi:hypothetical protein